MTVAPIRVLASTESRPIVMKTGCSVAWKERCSQRARREWTTITGAAMPAVVLKAPPSSPASIRGSPPVRWGSSGSQALTAIASMTIDPSTTCSQADESSRTSRAPATAPGTAQLTSTPARRQSTSRRTASMISKPETVVVALVTSTPWAEPSSSASTGAQTSPTPVPDRRCRTVPTRMAQAATSQTVMDSIVAERRPDARRVRGWSVPGCPHCRENDKGPARERGLWWTPRPCRGE